MKNTLLLLSFVATLLVGCDNPCKDVTCNNGGSCIEGVCYCTEGYIGSNCDSTLVDKFCGTYSVVDTGYFSWTIGWGGNECFTTFVIDRTHESVITSVSPTRFNISNLFGDGHDVEAWIDDGVGNHFTTSWGLYINYGTCEGQMYASGDNRPTGYISADHNTIVISFAHDEEVYLTGGNNYHYINNFVSTYTRQ